MIVAGLVDQLHFAGSDLLVDTRTVLLDGRRGSHWSANGAGLLMLFRLPRLGGLIRIVSNRGRVNTNAALLAIGRGWRRIRPRVPPAGLKIGVIDTNFKGAVGAAVPLRHRASASGPLRRARQNLQPPRRGRGRRSRNAPIPVAR